MTPPRMDSMWAAIQFYYNHVIEEEMNEVEFARWRDTLAENDANPAIATYYHQSLREAKGEQQRRLSA